MAKHWCKEHQTVWFKSGKMKGYAHPIVDENGEPTGEWCNEPEEEKPTKSKTSDDMTKEEWAEKNRTERASIEAQVAFKGLVELVAAQVVDKESVEFQTVINWAMSKLSLWSPSGGTIPLADEAKKIFSEKEKSNPIEVDVDILAGAIKVINDKEYITGLKKKYGMTASGLKAALSQLTSAKQEAFSKEIQAKLKGIEDEEIEPDDIPW